MQSKHDSIPDLKFEPLNDEHGSLILLEQNGGAGETASVAIHQIHLRLLADAFGLFPTSDPEGARTITALQRRMLTLRDRVKRLASELEGTASHPHAQATADIASEFCQDFAPTEQLQHGQLELIG